MGLTKFLEERRKQKTAEAIYRREQQVAYQQGLHQGRVQGSYQAGLKQGKQEAQQPHQSALRSGFGMLGNIAKEIGRLEPSPMQKNIWGFDFEPRRQKAKPKKHKR